MSLTFQYKLYEFGLALIYTSLMEGKLIKEVSSFETFFFLQNDYQIQLKTGMKNVSCR